MVYTLTCSPSVEYAAEMAEFLLGIRNCSKNEQAVPGGKGIHIARKRPALPAVSISAHKAPQGRRPRKVSEYPPFAVRPAVQAGKPFLIKPNRQELEEFAGRRLFTWQELLKEGRRMQEMGAENVLISLAAEGAVLLGGDDVLCGEAPRGYKYITPDSPCQYQM